MDDPETKARLCVSASVGFVGRHFLGDWTGTGQAYFGGQLGEEGLERTASVSLGRSACRVESLGNRTTCI